MRKNFSGACGSSAGNDAGGRGEREGEMTETPAASGAPAAHGPDYGIVERMRVAREARLERWSWICLALIAAMQVNAALLPVAQAVLAALGIGPGPGGK